mmetsp:Transcript_18218/g.37923  ORF Transcript_18218/g.37923 Transcript_18218/m.37923 type:complete len:97 (+) Transcript_18218:114-404(+)
MVWICTTAYDVYATNDDPMNYSRMLRPPRCLSLYLETKGGRKQTMMIAKVVLVTTLKSSFYIIYLLSTFESQHVPSSIFPFGLPGDQASPKQWFPV